MPYYDFQCAGCGGEFELHLAVERRDDAACPTCGSREVRRAMPQVYAIVRSAGAGVAAREDGPCCGEGGGCGCGGGGCGCGL